MHHHCDSIPCSLLSTPTLPTTSTHFYLPLLSFFLSFTLSTLSFNRPLQSCLLWPTKEDRAQSQKLSSHSLLCRTQFCYSSQSSPSSWEHLGTPVTNPSSNLLNRTSVGFSSPLPWLSYSLFDGSLPLTISTPYSRGTEAGETATSPPLKVALPGLWLLLSASCSL